MDPEIIAKLKESKLADECQAENSEDGSRSTQEQEYSDNDSVASNASWATETERDDGLDAHEQYREENLESDDQGFEEEQYQEEYTDQDDQDDASYSRRESGNTESLSKITPRTWESWTSSMSSSPRKPYIRPSLKKSSRWSDYPIPWDKIADKEQPGRNALTNVTTLYRFSNIVEPRHGTRYGTQRKFRAGVIKNPQWPSNNFITCLLCGRSGHLCHQCSFYEHKASRRSRYKVFDPMSDVEEDSENELESPQSIDSQSRAGGGAPEPISVAASLMNMYTRTNGNGGDGMAYVALDRGLASSSPLLCQVDRFHLGGPPPGCKSQCRTHESYGALLEPHGRAQFGPCARVRSRVPGYKELKTMLTYCYLCGSPGHTTNKCRTGPYCKYTGNKQSKGKRSTKQSAMSFRIRGRPSYDPDSEANECHQCHGYRGTHNVYSAGSSSMSDSEDTHLMIRKKVVDPYKELDQDCDELYCSKSRGYSTPGANFLDSEESVAIVCGKVNGVQTTMLLDTGSSISAITERFAQQLHLETWYTDDILVVTLANTHVERYPERMCVVTLEIGDLEICEELNVLPGQIYNVTLGKNWLKSHMAICDYGLDILRLPSSRPIRMGLAAPPRQLKSALKKKHSSSPRRQLAQSAEVVRPSYSSLHSLLSLGGWLPPPHPSTD